MLTTMSSVPFQQKALSSSKAWGYLALNQLAFPGAGTVMGGRREGYVQAVVMGVGVVLVVDYFLALISSVVKNTFDFTAKEGVGEQELESPFHLHAWGREIRRSLWLG